MIREYGGYLPVDTRGEEFFADSVYDNTILRLNAARYAIIEAYKIGDYDKLWIPVYMCASVYDAIKSDGTVTYDFYNVNDRLEPDINGIRMKDCILIPNYFGQKNKSFYLEQITKFRNVIFDNTQCFYTEPVMNSGVFNVYSPRKFFGVSDGAYLIGKDVNSSIQSKYSVDMSANRIGFVFESFEKGTNISYMKYLDSEKDISESGVKTMSKVTMALLGNIDYKEIHKRRLTNYRILCKEFKEINEIQINEEATSPMIYPLLIRNDGLRKRMVDSRIYIPQWWKIVIKNPKANNWERYISEFLYPLPIDQRYKKDDMHSMAEKIKGLM